MLLISVAGKMPLDGELEVQIESIFVWKQACTHHQHCLSSLSSLSLLSLFHPFSTLLFSGVRTHYLYCSVCLIKVITVGMSIFSVMLWLD